MSYETCLCQKICKWFIASEDNTGGCKLFQDDYCEHLDEMLDKLFDDEYKDGNSGW